MNGNGPTRRLRLTPASTIQPRPVRWLWRDRIPAGEVTLTPGKGGVGKSTFHVWLIAHLTRGTLPGVHYGTPRPVVICAAEDSWARTIVPRLMAAGADLGMVYRADVFTETSDELSLSLPVDCAALEKQLGTVGAVLLSLDPLMSTIAGTIDTHKDAEVRQALEPLAKLADRTGCTVLGNAHFNKSMGNDPMSLIMGSAAFGNVVRAALGFARNDDGDDGGCVISQVKNNLGKLDLPSLAYIIEEAIIDTPEGPASVGRLVMRGESERTVTDILGSRGGDDGESRTERDEAVEWLKGYLKDNGGDVTAGDAIKAAAKDGIAERTLQRARLRAKVASAKGGLREGWRWRLNAEGDTEGAEGARLTEPGTFGAFVAPSEIGQCIRCGDSCRRYGDDGGPLCATCREAS